MSKVFISYSHDSDEHRKKVLAFANQLRKDGIESILDQYLNGAPPEGWPLWMEQQMDASQFVLIVCTETYLNRVQRKELPGKGQGVKWESLLTYNDIYSNDALNAKFIPILFQEDDKIFIPKPLKGTSRFTVTDVGQYDSLYRYLTNQPKVIAPEVSQLRILPKEEISDFFDKTNISDRPTKIDLSRLPVSSTPLFGREKELEILDKAWGDTNTRILSFVAFGGVGKTALVNEWLNRMDAANFRGAVRVYGWSFYSQGTREDGQASADGFINDAIQWFEGYGGSPSPAIALSASPFEKGRYLAQLIAEEPTLLVLDGLEPLQYPPGPLHGKLKDQGMQALLCGLSRTMNGLCVLSTRVEVEELKATKSRFTPAHELEQLSVPAGAQLLQYFKLRGTKDDFKQTVLELKGHALALNLLGSYLSTVHAGDLRQRDRIPALFAEEAQGGHARRVMAGYEDWFKGKPELEVLYLLGLFDRPVGMEVIEVLKAEPAIPGLTDQLQNLPHAQWQLTLKHLRDAKLLNKDTNALDCHPLVREHFGEQLKNQYPAAWTAAHSRLYDYYKNLPDKELPDTLAEMEPLFLAVRHGCLAGKQQEALDDVYWGRIRREGEGYIVKKLGAFGAYLSCLAHFFESLWDKPAISLIEPAKAGILNWAGFALRAVGRLAEAAQPMQAGLEMRIQQKNWKECVIILSNLSELLLTIGQIPAAIEYGQQSVEYADRSGDGFMKETARTVFANAYLQNGQFQQAQALFQEAEQMQQEQQPSYDYLYSLRGFQYCDLLLETGQVQEVLERATTTLEYRHQGWYTLLDIALDLLSLSKAHFQQALQAAAPDFHEAAHYFQQAVDGLRKAGTQDHLPLGLLARAALYRMQGSYAHAWEDLEEVLETARYGGMKRYLTDYYLEAARVISQQLNSRQLGSRQLDSQESDSRQSESQGLGGDSGLSTEDYRLTENGETLRLSRAEMEAKYRDFVEQAAALIAETGYFRRQGELETLRKGI